MGHAKTKMTDMMEPAPALEMTDDCHHYTEIGEVPWDLHKYWQQRYSIFPNYDDEVYLTDDAWFGVTPQPVAECVALFSHGRVPAC